MGMKLVTLSSFCFMKAIVRARDLQFVLTYAY